MRRFYLSRSEDSTFELNLAPMLDIIVSIVPMLLLSIVFVKIAVIETPVPQAVEKAMQAAQDKPNETQIVLAVSKTSGFKITVTDKGENRDVVIGLKGQEFDYDALHKEAVTLKQQYPNIFRMEMHPEENIDLKEIVATMDQIRNKATTDPKIFFNDVDTGKSVETNLVFPDIVFGNVAGG